MKAAVIASSLFLPAAAAEPNYEALWTGFKNRYNRQFPTNSVEEVTRFGLFKAKVDEIIAINKAHDSFTVGINEFADLTPQEFKSMYLGFKPELRKKNTLKSTPWKPVDASLVADSIDWTTKGAVTPVKDQGQCGSCWAFSTTGGVEGAYAVSSGNLVSLSEQQLTSCDKTDSGCQGGLMDYGFEYIQKYGVATESNYPYTSGSGSSGSCQSGHPASVTVTGYTDVPSQNEDSLQQAVSQHPVSVAIEADQTVFQSYTSGILDSSACGTQLDHGVLAVGYGTDNGVAYWKVKNSWGTSWGDQGYIRMAKGKNMCGISQEPSYPTGAKSAASVVV